LFNEKAITRLQAIIIAAVIIVAAIGAGGYYYYYLQVREQKKILVMGSTGDIIFNLDPGYDYSTWTMSLNYQVFDRLYRVQPGIFPEIKYIPDLATGEPTISSDNLEWTITLRQGVKFHDGTPFNASCVKFSIDRAITMNQYPAWILEMVDKVDVIDNYTVKITLKYPYAALKGVLSMGVCGIVSPTAVQKMSTADFEEKPVGAGPFKYVEWVKGDHVTLERFEDYWNKDMMPKVDRIVYKIFTDAHTMRLALENGEIDTAWWGIAGTDWPSLMENPKIGYAQYDLMFIHWMTLNLGIPESPLQDVRVRDAVCCSIDRDEISKKVFNNTWPIVKDSVFLPGMMDKPSWRPFTATNITKAKQLLAEAGYPNGIDIALYYTPVEELKEEPEVAVLLQQQLAKAGIRVSLNPLEAGIFHDQFRAGILESALGLMGPDWPDPDSTAYFIAHSQGSYAKRVRLNDTELDNLVIQGRVTVDPSEREEIYGQIQDRLAEKMCYVPLVRQVVYHFYRSDITGVEPYYLFNPPWWLIDKK